MSSIRLSGSTSGYYDLTVPAAAGTNSIDLSNLATTNTANTFNNVIAVQNGGFDARLRLQNTGAGGTTFDIYSTMNSFAQGSETLLVNYGGSPNNVPNGLLKIKSDGHINKPYQPAFFSYGSAGWVTFSNGSDTRIVFTNSSFDIGGNMNNSTGIFTCPVAGIYHFSYGTYGRLQAGNGNNTNYWGSHLRKNSARITNTSIVGYYEDGDNDNHTSMSMYVSCAANDTIDVVARSAGPNNGEYYGSHCWLSGALVS